jgi:hypothetical protein
MVQKVACFAPVVSFTIGPPIWRPCLRVRNGGSHSVSTDVCPEPWLAKSWQTSLNGSGWSSSVLPFDAQNVAAKVQSRTSPSNQRSTGLNGLRSPGCGIRYSTAQHSTAQHSTAQHSTAQHSSRVRSHRCQIGYCWLGGHVART